MELDLKLIQTEWIPMNLIDPNKGQIEGVKANPRVLRDDKFRKLKKSIQDNPDMMALRELMVYEHEGRYVTIGGNQRLEALRSLKIAEAPCKVIPADTTPEQLNAYIVLDNAPFGEWDWDALANEWDAADLSDWGVDFPQDWANPTGEEPSGDDNAHGSDDKGERQRDPESEVIIATVSLFGTTEDMMLTAPLTTDDADKLISLAKKEGAAELMKRIIEAL